MSMRAYTAPEGAQACADAIQRARDYAKLSLHLSDEEFDELRVIADPEFGAAKMTPNEIGDDPARQETFRKLAARGYVTIEEYP